MGFPVNRDRACAVADIDDAKLAPFEEGMALGRFRLGLRWQNNAAFDRHGAANDEALIVGIIEVHFIRREQA